MTPGARGCRVGAVVMTALALGGAAWGHAILVRSVPANGSALAQPPSVVRAWFSEPLAPASTLRLYTRSHRFLATGGVDPRDRTHTVLALRPPRLGPGIYVIQWYAVSADDGAVRRGEFRFSVR